MDSSKLTQLFNDERRRCFTPSPDFCQGVMSRLSERPPSRTTISEATIEVAQPIAVFGLIAIAALIGLHVMKTPELKRGPTQIYLDLEIPVTEQQLYVEPNLPEAILVEELVAEGIE